MLRPPVKILKYSLEQVLFEEFEVFILFLIFLIEFGCIKHTHILATFMNLVTVHYIIIDFLNIYGKI